MLLKGFQNSVEVFGLCVKERLMVFDGSASMMMRICIICDVYILDQEIFHSLEDYNMENFVFTEVYNNY